MNIFPYQDFLPPTMNFCESNIYWYLQQPANTLSNLGFIILFIYIVRKKRKFESLDFSILLIGVFSFLYHSTFTLIGQTLDLVSMFLLGAFLIISINNKYQENYFYVLVSSFLTFVANYFFKINIGIIFFALQILFFIYIIFTDNPTLKNRIKKSLLIFLIGLIFWLLDFFRIWCDQASMHYINGHAIWHILCAVSLFYLWGELRESRGKIL